MQKGERAQLRDVINYEPQQYLDEQEINLIRSTFGDNPKLIAILRKLLVPTFSDPSLPIEEISSDVWLNRDWAQVPADEAKILQVARQDAIKFIFGMLIKLQVIANSKVESEMEAALRRSKDSVK